MNHASRPSKSNAAVARAAYPQFPSACGAARPPPIAGSLRGFITLILDLMNQVPQYKLPRVALTTAVAASLSACTTTPSTQSQAQFPLLGTWAEIVTVGAANPEDGRQVIERFPNGTFKLVFVRTHPAQLFCEGTWKISGSTVLMAFTSIECFSAKASKPVVRTQYQLDILEASATRLKFKIPEGLPLAFWQAKLEGGIE